MLARVEQSRAVKTFDALFAELSDKARTRPDGSGTVAALDGGVHGLGKKILEEAGEVWLAAEHEGDDALAEEISQLLYWTQVLMISRGLTLDDVYREAVNGMLRVAVPNKGTLSEPAAEILSEAGYRRRTDPKDLTVLDPANNVEFFFLRPKDIAIYVGSGELDFGITGRDLAADSDAPVARAAGAGLRLVHASATPPRRAGTGQSPTSPASGSPPRIPNLVRKDLAAQGHRGDRHPPRRRGGDLGPARRRRRHRRRGRLRPHAAPARPGGLRRAAVRFGGGADRARRTRRRRCRGP